MRARILWCTTLLLLCHPLLWSQAVTRQLPSAQSGQSGSQPQPGNPQAAPEADPAANQDQVQQPFALPAGVGPATDPAFADPAFAPPPDPSAGLQTQPTQPAPAPEPQPAMPDEADQAEQPADADPSVAHPLPIPPAGTPVHIEADTQRKDGDVYTLDGNVLIDYREYVVRADHATYDTDSSVVNARGHVTVDGGPSDEHMVADHGVMNLDAHTAHFYDVTGTLGVRAITHDRYVFTAPNPFAITGDELLQLGPNDYKVIHGTMTSCRLPNPDWKLLSKTILIDDGQATARNSFFALAGVPLLYLPFVTHPVERNERQSGFLLPIFGNDTTKGLILGEQVYLVLGRSADLAFGSQYYSRRGFAPQGQFRYKGAGEDFAYVRFRSLLDRLPAATNQGGVNLSVDGRRALSSETRVVADVEYLSSYVYRQAFEENYSAAINSEVKSKAYLLHEHHGFAQSAVFQRYQSFRSDAPGDEINVLHTPVLEVTALDHALGNSRFLWGGEAAAAAMSRSEPGFVSSTFIPRVDLYPHIVLPLSAGGWTLRAEAGLRETYYGRSQTPGALGSVPTERDAGLNRTAFTSELDLRPPAVERDFDAPFLHRRLGADLRHSIEPEFRYRFITGINNFASVLRFDNTDVLADTNELEYGLTQHVYLRHLHTRPCRSDEALAPSDSCGGGTLDWITWTLAQKYFFDRNFGGALVKGARNVLESTLDFSGIAFSTRPREISPVISRLRLRTTTRTDVEWDLDYDTQRGHLLSSNAIAGYQAGLAYLSIGNYRLHTLGGDAGDGTTATAATSPGSVSDFNQLRLAAIYGSPIRHGLSAGVNLGYDFKAGQTQYVSGEAGYNRDCCGLTFEIRRYSLGSVRDDTQYLFSFTLAGVGTAGNLNHLVRVF